MRRSLLALTTSLLLLAPGATAQRTRTLDSTRRLNDTLAQLSAGNVTRFLVSPDDARIAYLADQIADERFELFTAPTAGGPIARLNADLPPGGDVSDMAFASASQVVYVADQTVDDRFDLLAAPADGQSAPTPLATMPAAGDVSALMVAPAAGRVLFVADALVDERDELFTVPADGSAAATPIDPVFPDADVALVLVTPDDLTAVYVITGSPSMLLFSAPVDASAAPVLLADSGLASSGNSTFFQPEISHDGSRVVYRAFDSTPSTTRGIYSVPVDGSAAPVRLDQGAPQGQYVQGPGRVLFIEAGDLFSVTLDGSQAVTLNPAGTTVTQGGILITPDGTRAVFSAPALYVAPIDGSQPATDLSTTSFNDAPLGFDSLSTRLLVGSFSSPATYLSSIDLATTSSTNVGSVSGFIITRKPAAGDRVVVLGSLPQVAQAASILVDGSQPPVLLHPPLTAPFTVFELDTDHAGSRAYLRAFLEPGHGTELYGIDVAGAGPLLRYNDPLPGGPILGRVSDFESSVSGERVVYRASQDLPNQDDLYTVATAGGESTRVWEQLPPNIGVLDDYWLSPDGEHVVFAFREGACPVPCDFTYRVFAADTGGLADAVLLHTWYSDHYTSSDFVFDPDGTAVTGRVEDVLLYQFLLDGSGAQEIGLASDFEVTPDHTAAVLQFVQDLSVAPLDGSAPPMPLVAPQQRVASSFGGGPAGFHVTSDGTAVVFRASATGNPQTKLFLVPLDGSELPRKLSLASDGNVAAFELTPEGSRAVYLTTRQGGAVSGLYVTDLVGRRGHVRTQDGETQHPPRSLVSVTGAVESDFHVTPDSLQVVFRADALTPGTTELFHVPLDGSGAATRLSAPLTAGGDVLDFQIAADGATVVYRTRQGQKDTIHAAPLGGGPVVDLSSLPADGDVTSFAITLDAARVVYRADRFADQRFELFSVPIGGGATRRVNLPLAEFGTVKEDYRVLPGGRVLHLADQAEVNRVELFLGYAALDVTEAR